MSKRIIDRKQLQKNTTKLVRWMDKNLFGIECLKQHKKNDIFGDIIDEWNSNDKKPQ